MSKLFFYNIFIQQKEKNLVANKNSKVLFLILIAGSSFSFFSIESFSQTTDNVTNMTNLLFDDFYPMVMVEYESDSLIVLRSDENVILPLNGTLAPLWNAIDIIEKKTNFTFKEFKATQLSLDEKLEPTTIFYAIMIK